MLIVIIGAMFCEDQFSCLGPLACNFSLQKCVWYICLCACVYRLVLVILQGLHSSVVVDVKASKLSSLAGVSVCLPQATFLDLLTNQPPMLHPILHSYHIDGTNYYKSDTKDEPDQPVLLILLWIRLSALSLLRDNFIVSFSHSYWSSPTAMLQ